MNYLTSDNKPVDYSYLKDRDTEWLLSDLQEITTRPYRNKLINHHLHPPNGWSPKTYSPDMARANAIVVEIKRRGKMPVGEYHDPDIDVKYHENGITELSDGSGFFTATIGGPRPGGLVNLLKYTDKATARTWLLLYRNYRSAVECSKLPEQGPPMTHLQALKWAITVTLGVTWFDSKSTWLHNKLMDIYNLSPVDETVHKVVNVTFDPNNHDGKWIVELDATRRDNSDNGYTYRFEADELEYALSELRFDIVAGCKVVIDSAKVDQIIDWSRMKK